MYIFTGHYLLPCAAYHLKFVCLWRGERKAEISRMVDNGEVSRARGKCERAEEMRYEHFFRFIYLSIYLFTYLYIYLLIYLFIYLFIHLLFIYLFSHLSIY